jgi:ribosomal protein S12 methylthiotransferase accessory factor YcaO
MHDIQPQTVRVLDEVIGRLQREGFDIQRTDATLGKKKPAIS